ncbi:PREDICTED: zinc finger protein 600 [Dinoponera quadriceps]|uniref:Zinc finger protein 600 n=1 Tax=Dinoponera quadriceps TaxID=609295 RepID=A0A6P3Y7K9_DINQU|nr:PREDICTED: zinc finger protein 600 [Dinoponera quadriceps]
MLPTRSRKHRYFSGVTFGSVSSEEKSKTKRSREDNSAKDVRAQAITTSRIYPVVPQNAQELEGTDVSQGYTNFVSSIVCTTVRAAGNLSKNCSTEIIDVNALAQRSISVADHIEIVEVGGRLYCVDGFMNTPCWLKTIDIAQDISMCNVKLTSAKEGVFLKTVKSIKAGESLQMWFTEEILLMLNIPFLLPMNIRSNKSYICHICSRIFEYPNPLKLHIALNCNRLNKAHIWTYLAKGFATLGSSGTRLTSSLYPQTSFTFELTSPTMTLPANVLSPILTETVYTGVSLRNDSPCSNQPSPLSLSQLSSSSSSIETPNPLDQMAPTEGLTSRHSAFKPYVPRDNVSRSRFAPYNVRLPAVTSLETDAIAIDMETIVSNAGKSKEGHRCIYCGKLYSRKYGLKIHIRTHTGYKPLKCAFCERAFGDPSNLNKHIRLHTDGDTPYKCHICSKVMVRRRDLDRHLKSRHQRKQAENASEESTSAIDTARTIEI